MIRKYAFLHLTTREKRTSLSAHQGPTKNCFKLFVPLFLSCSRCQFQRTRQSHYLSLPSRYELTPNKHQLASIHIHIHIHIHISTISILETEPKRLQFFLPPSHHKNSPFHKDEPINDSNNRTITLS